MTTNKFITTKIDRPYMDRLKNSISDYINSSWGLKDSNRKVKVVDLSVEFEEEKPFVLAEHLTHNTEEDVPIFNEKDVRRAYDEIIDGLNRSLLLYQEDAKAYAVTKQNIDIIKDKFGFEKEEVQNFGCSESKCKHEPTLITSEYVRWKKQCKHCGEWY